jgi:hypothetical protein
MGNALNLGRKEVHMKFFLQTVAVNLMLGSIFLPLVAVIRDNIGWALTKDRPLLEGTLAHDERLFIFNPDSRSTAGWDQFVKGFDFWMDQRFKATKLDIRDLRIDLSRSGDVAWWSCILDDLGEWDGKPIGWKDTRWTGVLEKRDGA